jgi:hypothetical protein
MDNSRVLLAAEETFGGGNLRGPNIQPIGNSNHSYLLIMDRLEQNGVAAHPYLMSLHEATGVYSRFLNSF